MASERPDDTKCPEATDGNSIDARRNETPKTMERTFREQLSNLPTGKRGSASTMAERNKRSQMGIETPVGSEHRNSLGSVIREQGSPAMSVLADVQQLRNEDGEIDRNQDLCNLSSSDTINESRQLARTANRSSFTSKRRPPIPPKRYLFENDCGEGVSTEQLSTYKTSTVQDRCLPTEPSERPNNSPSTVKIKPTVPRRRPNVNAERNTEHTSIQPTEVSDQVDRPTTLSSKKPIAAPRISTIRVSQNDMNINVSSSNTDDVKSRTTSQVDIQNSLPSNKPMVASRRSKTVSPDEININLCSVSSSNKDDGRSQTSEQIDSYNSFPSNKHMLASRRSKNASPDDINVNLCSASSSTIDEVGNPETKKAFRPNSLPSKKPMVALRRSKNVSPGDISINLCSASSSNKDDGRSQTSEQTVRHNSLPSNKPMVAPRISRRSKIITSEDVNTDFCSANADLCKASVSSGRLSSSDSDNRPTYRPFPSNCISSTVGSSSMDVTKQTVAFQQPIEDNIHCNLLQDRKGELATILLSNGSCE